MMDKNQKERIAQKAMTFLDMPNPETHRPCVVCRQWLPNDCFSDTPPSPLELTNPGSFFLAVGRLASGYRSQTQRVCADCLARRRKVKKLLYGALLLTMGGILLLEFLGFL